MAYSAFDLFKLRHNGSDFRESYIKNTRDIIESRFADDPAFRKVKVVGKRDIYVRASKYRKEGFLMPKMDIQSTLDNEFATGDLFFFDGEYWLCTMKHNFHDVYYRGEITQCNNILRFQLPGDYEIHEMYAIVERPFSKNISTNQVIQISVKEYRVRAQLTDVTKRIFLGQRFIIGMGYDSNGDEIPDVYSVESPDSLSNAVIFEEGFLILNLKADQYDKDKDNKELLVANYRKPPEVLPITPSKCQIESMDNKYEVRYGDPFSKLFVGKVFDMGGEEVDVGNVEFEWTISGNELQEKYLELDSSENNILKLKCKMPKNDNDITALLNTSFELILNAKNTVFDEYRVNIKIKSLI